MLSGRPFHAGAALSQSKYLGIVHHLVPFFQIMQCKTVCGFLRHTGDRSRFKHVILAEQFFGIAMGACLIFSREIQVDIRRLVTVKAQKGFKRNIVSVPIEKSSAMRTVLLWQIKAGPDRTVGNKFTVFTLRADIVRHQRIYL